MKTTARELIEEFFWATRDDLLYYMDSGVLLGNYPALPALERGDHAIVMGDDTGESGDEDADGYMFTTFAYSNLDDRWEPVADSEYAATAQDAYAAIAAWFDGLPA